MDDSDSAMSQHRNCLHHQQEPIHDQKEDLDGLRVNLVFLELIKGEVAEQNQLGNVDEEEHKDHGVAQAEEGLVDVIDGGQRGGNWLELAVNQNFFSSSSRKCVSRLSMTLLALLFLCSTIHRKWQ